MVFDIRRDDLSGADVQALVQEHMAGMLSNSPLESVHALPLDGLRKPEITFWSIWLNDELCVRIPEHRDRSFRQIVTADSGILTSDSGLS
jgi:hypothetical protein